MSTTGQQLEDRLITEIRQHLEGPCGEARRWTAPSYADVPGAELTIVASRDTDQRRSWRRRLGYQHRLHLSFVNHVGGRATLVHNDDLNHWVPAILGRYVRYAHRRPVTQRGDAADLTEWSTITTHIDVFLDRRGRPLVPAGPTANTPWRVDV